MIKLKSLKDRNFIGRSALDNPLIKNLVGINDATAKMQLEQYTKLYDSVTCANCFVKDTSGAFNFTTNALEVIETELQAIITADSSLDNIVAMQNNVPFGARTTAYRTIQRFGTPMPLGNTSNRLPSGLPLATTSTDLKNLVLKSWGIKVAWNVEEIAASLLSGVPLEMEQVQAAVDAAMKLKRLAITVGKAGAPNPEKALALEYPEFSTGKFNDAGIDAATATQTVWSGVSESDAPNIRKAITNAIGDVWEASQETVGELAQFGIGMTVFLPPAQYRIVNDLLDGTFRNDSVLETAAKRNVWTSQTGNLVKFVPVRELVGIGAASTDRMCIGFVNPNVDVMKISQELMQGQQESRDFVTSVPFLYAHSPIGIRQPVMMNYRDGI